MVRSSEDRPVVEFDPQSTTFAADPLGAYRALRECGYRVPDDVTLVGCDGIAEAKYLDAPLTTIEQPIVEMCRIGWQFLKQRMENNALPVQSATLRSELVVRKSSLGPTST